MNYKPEPIDVSNVTLTDDLMQLAEQLAENAHDIWAQKRMSEGWTYGPERDDAAKRHPCLVPYRALPESEKDYDREMALSTVKVIASLGYRITKA